ncbi:unnamed protein product [Boreogadus saida]
MHHRGVGGDHPGKSSHLGKLRAVPNKKQSDPGQAPGARDPCHLAAVKDPGEEGEHQAGWSSYRMAGHRSAALFVQAESMDDEEAQEPPLPTSGAHPSDDITEPHQARL